jgi:hypothetical protein
VINGEKVIEDTLSDKKKTGRFRGTWKGHDVLAECVLTTKVDCAVSLDAAPDKLTQPPAAEPTSEPQKAVKPKKK